MLVMLLAAFGTVTWFDDGDVNARPWWPRLVVPALFVTAFLVVLGVESVRAYRQGRRGDSAR
jgi:hypothetical protein